MITHVFVFCVFFVVWIERQYIADVISDSVMYCFRYVFPYTLGHYSDRATDLIARGTQPRNRDGGAGGAEDQGEPTTGQT